MHTLPYKITLKIDHKVHQCDFARIDIRKITFKRRRFFIELRPNQDTGEQNAVGFHMDSYDGCKQLWKDCIDYHAFFRSVHTLFRCIVAASMYV